MLIDNTFIFISLPRCASTSFFVTCLKSNIPVEHFDSNSDNQLNGIDGWQTMDNELLADRLTHNHEPLLDLTKKFGKNFPIISIKRNKYERFLSLWKHIIDELFRIGQTELATTFTKLTIDDIFYNITSNDVINLEKKEIIIDDFVNRFKIPKEKWYIRNMINILITPISEFTNNDPNIIWFDINNLSELEMWVSSKLDIQFKLEKINSSQKYNSTIIIDDIFKEKYDKIYSITENRKSNKTLL